LLASQSFGLTEDQPHAYWSTLKAKPIPSTQPNEPEFAEFGLPNKELGPFSSDEDKILCNQPHQEHDEEADPTPPSTTILAYYMAIHMQNVDLESNFQDFELVIRWIAKKSNIRWEPSLKEFVLKPKKKYNMLCSSIM